MVEGQNTVLRVSGQIAVEHIPQLRAEIESARGAELDLDEVRLVNAEVIEFLGECRRNGVQFRNCPEYICEWIRKAGGPSTPARETLTGEERG